MANVEHKLTQETQDRICDIIKTGNYIETACAYAGICRKQFYNWLRDGRRDLDAGKDNKYTRFVKAVDEAKAFAEMRDLNRIDDAASNGQWQAAAWRLERRYRDRWGKAVEIKADANVNLSGSIEISDADMEKMTPEELEVLAKLRRKDGE